MEDTPKGQGFANGTPTAGRGGEPTPTPLPRPAGKAAVAVASSLSTSASYPGLDAHKRGRRTR